jgi:hypothetical protein
MLGEDGEVAAGSWSTLRKRSSIAFMAAAAGFLAQSSAVTGGCWERMARLPPAAGCAAISLKKVIHSE